MNDLERRNYTKKTNIICFIVVMVFITGLVLGSFLRNEVVKEIRQQAIQHGFAEYNPTNAVWQWKMNDFNK